MSIIHSTLRMHKLLLFLPVLSLSLSQAQPLLDAVNIKYTNSPDAGIVRRNEQPARFVNFLFTLNLPVILKKDSSALVFSPYAEGWNLNIDNTSFLPTRFQGFGVQLTYIKSISVRWTMTFSLIPRWNGYNGHWFDNNFQAGGAVLATHKRTNAFKYKFGLYYNSEFSGDFFTPLLGIDWRLNSKNNIYGVLPGSLIWEHKINKWFYYGASFKAITNSYRAGMVNSKNYFLRIDDNQLMAFADLYLTKNIVFTAEAGQSVLRRLRMGYKNGAEKYFYTDKINDNVLLKGSLAYRVRL